MFKIRHIYRKLAPVLILAAVLFRQVRAIAEEDFCCKLETDKTASAQALIPTPLPETESACKWVRDFPGEAVFLTSQQLIVALRFSCFEGFGVIKETEDRIYELDAKTGKILNKASWHDRNPQTKHGIQLFPLDPRTVLFRSGNVLRILSVDLAEIRSRVAASSIDDLELTYLILSPDSHSAVLNYANGRIPTAQNYWFSPDTLDQMTVEAAPRSPGKVALTDDRGEYYVVNEGPIGGRPQAIVYFRRKGDGSGQRLCESCVGLPEKVLTSGLLVIDRDQLIPSFMLVDHEGHVQHEETYGEPIERGAAYVSTSRCNRFAYIYGHLPRSGSAVIAHVVVFDADQMKKIVTIKIKAFLVRDDGLDLSPGVKVALSPTGDKLAILYGSNVRFFSLNAKRTHP